MFCPNCGTKNEDNVEKCTQCGFDLQKKAAPKFKGTMLMQGGPNPTAGATPPAAGPAAPRPSAAALKGTMVGVAPPNIAELRQQMEQAAQTEAAAPRPSVAMKGTMVGVAPPGIEELRRQMAEASSSSPAAPAPAATPAAAPSSAPPAAPAAPAVSKPQLKGTMIGVAPPNIAELRKQLDAQQAAPAAAPAVPAPVAAAPAASAGPAPSKLKGTMLGVAPPDMAALLEKGRQAEAEAATTPAPPPEDDVNAFGGTVVGTSPFAPGGQYAEMAAAGSAPLQAVPAHTVPSPAEEPVPERRSDRPEAFARTSISEPPPALESPERATTPSERAPAAPSRVTYAPPRGKSNNNAVIALGIGIMVLLGLVIALLMQQ